MSPALLHARSLAPLVNARGFGMTPGEELACGRRYRGPIQTGHPDPFDSLAPRSLRAGFRGRLSLHRPVPRFRTWAEAPFSLPIDAALKRRSSTAMESAPHGQPRRLSPHDPFCGEHASFTRGTDEGVRRYTILVIIWA
jgi:hypothetical protein